MSRLTISLAVVLVVGDASSVLAAQPPAAGAPPGVAASVRRGVSYLKKSISGQRGGHAVLGALALVKAGEPADGPEVQAVLADIQERCAASEYKRDSHHYYTAGLELMLLEAVDPERYRGEMEKILAYVLAGQRPSGPWYYPDQGGAPGAAGPGDTSITQYAVLGLWAASRAGLSVPRSTWDKMAVWHLRTQLRDGSFAYHPDEAVANAQPAAALTLAGAGSLTLARMHLFPSATGKPRQGANVTTVREERTGKKYGVLAPVDLDADNQRDVAAADERNYKLLSRPEAIQQAVDRAVAAAAMQFRLPPPTDWKLYYVYGLERTMALTDVATLGPHDWYAMGGKWLVAEQRPGGEWYDGSGNVPATAFAVLFLARSTGQMLGKTRGVAELGGGLLAGGRGLPDDLGRVNVAGGEVKTTGAAGPLDELLARLEDAKAADVPAAQQAILEAIQFGDREELLGQTERLRRLVGDPRAEVRRTAFWALGRGGELADVPRLIAGLSDPEASVAVEAHNALCVFARRPLAFGIPGDPFAGLPESASQADREGALTAWRGQAVAAWTDWYRRVAPYEERDGLGVFR